MKFTNIKQLTSTGATVPPRIMTAAGRYWGAIVLLSVLCIATAQVIGVYKAKYQLSRDTFQSFFLAGGVDLAWIATVVIAWRFSHATWWVRVAGFMAVLVSFTANLQSDWSGWDAMAVNHFVIDALPSLLALCLLEAAVHPPKIASQPSTQTVAPEVAPTPESIPVNIPRTKREKPVSLRTLQRRRQKEKKEEKA